MIIDDILHITSAQSVAVWCGLKRDTAVYNWRKRGVVPWKERQKVAQLAIKLGVIETIPPIESPLFGEYRVKEAS